MAQRTVFSRLCRMSSSSSRSSCLHRQSRVCVTNRLSHRKLSDYTSKYPSPEGAVKFEFQDPAFKVHRFEKQPNNFAQANKAEVLSLFEDMFRIRRMELRCDEYYKQKKIWGFCHLYDGQEAVCCGLKAALKPEDHIITAYREHGWAYICGDSVRGIFAEMFGKASGCARGKGGSMHLYWPEGRFYGGNGIVGAQIPVGTGIALAVKTKGLDEVVIAAMGDGAANQGQVYESYNMAALWKLPIVFLVENNHYGMGTAAHRAAAVSDFYTRGDYIPGIRVDGMDVLAVREGMRFARNYIAEGNGPLIMEAMTYRYHGHSMSDPGISYRSSDEVDKFRSQFDPISRVREWILNNKWMTDEELKAFEKDIRKKVDADAKDAEKDIMLTEEELVTDIYSTGPPRLVRYSDYPESILDGKTRVREA